MSAELPGWEEPTPAEWLDELRALGVVRAATWFDTFMDAHRFAASFRDERGEPTDELQDALYGVTGTVVAAVTPEFDDDAEFDAWEGKFGGGELVVDVDARTICVELAYGMREEQEARFSVDLASAESLFARQDDEDTDAEDVVGGGKGEWDVEWHAADRAIDLDDPAALGEIEHAMIAAGADPAAVREHMEPLEDLAAKLEEEREDEEDELDPAAVLDVLDHTLAALRSAGVRRAVIGYSGRSAIADGWPHGVDEVLAEAPWRLGDVDLDGRIVADGLSRFAARTLAATILIARLGDWNETGPTSGRSGVLDVDIGNGTATVTHRSTIWRPLSCDRVVLGPDVPS